RFSRPPHSTALPPLRVRAGRPAAEKEGFEADSAAQPWYAMVRRGGGGGGGGRGGWGGGGGAAAPTPPPRPAGEDGGPVEVVAGDIRDHEGGVLRGLPAGMGRDERRPVVVLPAGVDEHLAGRQCGVDRRLCERRVVAHDATAVGGVQERVALRRLLVAVRVERDREARGPALDVSVGDHVETNLRDRLGLGVLVDADGLTGQHDERRLVALDGGVSVTERLEVAPVRSQSDARDHPGDRDRGAENHCLAHVIPLPERGRTCRCSLCWFLRTTPTSPPVSQSFGRNV